MMDCVWCVNMKSSEANERAMRVNCVGTFVYPFRSRSSYSYRDFDVDRYIDRDHDYMLIDHD